MTGVLSNSVGLRSPSYTTCSYCTTVAQLANLLHDVQCRTAGANDNLLAAKSEQEWGMQLQTVQSFSLTFTGKFHTALRWSCDLNNLQCVPHTCAQNTLSSWSNTPQHNNMRLITRHLWNQRLQTRFDQVT